MDRLTIYLARPGPPQGAAAGFVITCRENEAMEPPTRLNRRRVPCITRPQYQIGMGEDQSQCAECGQINNSCCCVRSRTEGAIWAERWQSGYGL